MLPAIDFDDELPVGAEEVDDVSIDWDLPLEFPTGEAAVAQAKPERARRFGCDAVAWRSRSVLSPAEPPHPNPLPCGERELTESVARSSNHPLIPPSPYRSPLGLEVQVGEGGGAVGGLDHHEGVVGGGVAGVAAGGESRVAIGELARILCC